MSNHAEASSEDLGGRRPDGSGDRWFRGYQPSLDALRGIAILLVVAVHSPAAKVLPYAWCGVDLFFVLSGFLITGLLLDAPATPGRLRDFYVRRALRIWPLYVCVVGLALGVLPHVSPVFAVPQAARLWPWYLTFLQNYAPGAAVTLLVTWSLAIEEQFYLVWPWVVLLLGRRGLAGVALGILLASPVLRYALLAAGVAPVDVFRWGFTRMDGLAAGAAVACVVRSGIAPEALARASLPVLLAALAASAVTLPLGLRSIESTTRPVEYALGFSGLSVGFAALLAAVLGSPRLQRCLDIAALRRVGQISYGLYLIHPIVFLSVRTIDASALAAAVGGRRWLVSGGVWTIAVLASLLLAELSFRYLEVPWLRLKRHFTPSLPGGLPPQTPAVRVPAIPEPVPDAPDDADRRRRRASKASW